MALRQVVLLNVAFLVAGPPFFVALWRYRGGMAAWKRPMVVGSYLSVLSVTVLELTAATAIASYPQLAFALDMFVGLAALAGFVFFGRCWRLRRRPNDSGSTDAYMKSVRPA